MTEEEKKEPLEGFHITGYDETHEIVTIQVHRVLFNNPKSLEALQKAMVDIIKSGPNVKGVTVEPRGS